MKCIKCRRNAAIEVSNTGALCTKCLLELSEKRVRKGLKQSGPVNKGETIVFIDDGSAKSKASIALFRDIVQGLPVNVKIRSAKSAAGISKPANARVVIPWSLEDECTHFLSALFSGKKEASFPKNSIMLLKELSEDEITAIAKAKCLKFSRPEKKKDKIRLLIDSLEKRYPGYKRSLLNSIKEIRQIKCR